MVLYQTFLSPKNIKKENEVGQHGTESAFALLTHQPWVRFSAFPRIISEALLFLKNYSLLMLLGLIDGTSLSVEKLEYVDLVLVNGKLVSKNDMI